MNREYTENNTNEEFEAEQLSFKMKFKKYLLSFKRLWWISLVCAVVLASTSFAYFHITYEPRYRSDVRFTITPLVASDGSNGASVYSFNYNATLATQMATTFPYIINSGIMTDIISADMKRPYDAMISAKAVEDTNIFEITVTSASAQDSYDVIQSIIENYPVIAEYVIGDTRMNVIAGSEPILATEPYNEGGYYIYVMMFGLVGVLIGAVISFIDMQLSKTVETQGDVDDLFQRCICEIPDESKSRFGKAGGILRIGTALPGFSESMRVLKQRVKLNAKTRNAKVFGISSSIDGEGKTTVAYNLSMLLSSEDSKVLLLDMNLGSRKLQNILNRRKEVSGYGITDVVVGKTTVKEVIHSLSDKLDVMFAGEEEVKLRKSNFEEIFEILRENYDYIVVNMMPCGETSEIISVADLLDELLFVVRAGSVTTQRVGDSMDDIAFSNVHVMGYILNGVASSTDSGQKIFRRYSSRGGYGYGYGRGYGYGYGYGYGQEGRSGKNSKH